MKKICLIFYMFYFVSAYGYISENIINDCNNNDVFYPIFILNEYTCDSGYFLPANALECRMCPSGYTCPGGTFSFNPELAQGINLPNQITQNIPYACSLNFTVADMRPVFIPNETITVNFTNGEDTETITCTYDTEFTLPEPPTRVGYVFTGWKVKNAE